MKRAWRGLAALGAGLVLGVVVVVLMGGSLRVAVASEAPDPAAVITQTVVLEPAKDNTLYESELGAVSNGAGQHLFAGMTNDERLRRAVLSFDLSTVPPGAEVHSATLALHVSRTVSGETPVTVHALQRDWGEGDSDAPGEEGAGALAEPGDATWVFTFFNTARWTTTGGDFDAAPLATTSVGAVGDYAWSSPELAADVQRWLDDPSQNFGWIVLGDEATDGTAKRFDSRENPTQAQRPRLTITYLFDGSLLFAPVVMR